MNKLCTNNAITSHNIYYILIWDQASIDTFFWNTAGLHFCYTENKKCRSAKIRIASHFKITFAVNKFNVIYFLAAKAAL